MNPDENGTIISPSERRHRLNGVEVDPVMVAVYHRLLRLV